MHFLHHHPLKNHKNYQKLNLQNLTSAHPSPPPNFEFTWYILGPPPADPLLTHFVQLSWRLLRRLARRGLTTRGDPLAVRLDQLW